MTTNARHPENRTYAKLLQGTEERKTLAEKTGYTRDTINRILVGERRMTTAVKLAIVEIIQERRAVEAALEQALAENSNS
jgi:plasmid maintenance system antidote protein VapI